MWIKYIPFYRATGKLKTLYNRVKGPNDNVDNILMSHSLRPHSLEGHMKLYKNVLHHKDNLIPKWFLEVLGVYVSMLNDCNYCVNHHFAGFKRLLNDEEKSQKIWDALSADKPEQYFSDGKLAMIHYAHKLTKTPGLMERSDIQPLRNHGLSDGEILEVNQVVSYFSYANRTVLGLGVNTEGDILGLSPGDSDNPDNWSHG